VTEIILTSDQTQLLVNASDGVVFCDTTGNIVVRIPPKLDEEELAIVAEAKRRLASDQPRIPSSEVLARLDRLNQQANQ